MKKYKFNILAVKIGSIGKRKTFIVNVVAENEEAAKLALYQKYEHITINSINGKKYSYL